MFSVRGEDAPEDRRLSCRFPIEAEIRYLLLMGNATKETGRGRTVNISSGGILFESAHPIPPGTPIELSVTWPARIDGIVHIQLRVKGRTIRNQDSRTAVHILHYEFRTAGISELLCSSACVG